MATILHRRKLDIIGIADFPIAVALFRKCFLKTNF